MNQNALKIDESFDKFCKLDQKYNLKRLKLKKKYFRVLAIINKKYSSSFFLSSQLVLLFNAHQTAVDSSTFFRFFIILGCVQPWSWRWYRGRAVEGHQLSSSSSHFRQYYVEKIRSLQWAAKGNESNLPKKVTRNGENPPGTPGKPQGSRTLLEKVRYNYSYL